MKFKIIILLLLLLTNLILAQTNQWLFINKENSSLEFNIINSIEIDNSNKVWLGYSLYGYHSGLVKYDGTNWTLWNISKRDSFNWAFSAVKVDKYNNVWLHQNRRLYKFDGFDWNLYMNQSPLIMMYAKFPQIEIDKNDSKWIFSPTMMYLVKFNNSDFFLYYPGNSPLPVPWGGQVKAEGDSLWICTYGGLVLLYNDNWKTFDTTNTKMPSQRFFSFAKDSNGVRWLGTADKGLLKWVNDSTFISYNKSNSPMPDNFVNVITVDKNNNLWIGTDHGLVKFDGTNFTTFPDTYWWSILSIKIDRFNNKWIGTYISGPGLAIYNENGIIGVTSIYDESSSIHSYTLYQNYPNPFNPSTIINYELQKPGFVTLKVYDLLGREVQVLVNEYKNAGKHLVEFSVENGTGNKLSSGVYFYKLTAGDPSASSGQSFTDVKKMLLLR
jgi:ligand-binding sensor domain-containing protein